MIIFVYILLFFLVFLAAASLSIAPWLPTRRADLERINRLINWQPNQLFYELGCGDGRVCFYLAKKHPQIKIIGIEIVWYLYLWAKIRFWLGRYQNVEIRLGNAYKQNLAGADIIYVFATGKSINRLREKFIRELKSSARILSYAFAIQDWPGQSQIDQPNTKTLPIFIYGS